MAAFHNIPTERDLELLSAYLDGALTHRERETLEQRLVQESALREALDDLRTNVALMRRLPRLKAPRDFTLAPTLYGHKPPWWKRLFAFEIALQVSGALGAAASLVLITVAILSSSSRPAADKSPISAEQPDAPAIAYQIAETTDTAQQITASPTMGNTPPPTPSPVALNDLPTQPETAETAQDAAYDGSEGPPPAALGAFPSPDSAAAVEGEHYAAYQTAPGGMPTPTMHPAIDTDEGAGAATGSTMARENATVPPVFEAAAPQTEERQMTATPLETASSIESTATATSAGPPLRDDNETAQISRRAAQEESPDRWWLAGVGVIMLVVSAAAFVAGRRKSRL